MSRHEAIREFVDFQDDDLDRLDLLGEIVEDHIPEIVDSTAEALFRDDHVGPVIDTDDERRRVRELLHDWVEVLFDGTAPGSHAELQRRIGRTHFDHELDPEYLLGTLHLLRRKLTDLLVDAELDVPIGEALGSLDRILDFSATLLLDGYCRALVDEKNEVGRELASFMAHEIRNPLNSVELHLTILERRLEEEGEEGDYESVIDSVRSELGRIEELIVEINDFAQPFSPSPNWHDLATLLDEIERAQAPLFAEDTVEFRREAPEGTAIYCDAEHLKQALVCVLKNASEAGEDHEVVVRGRAEGNGTRITIHDGGDGLEDGTNERIFELFFTTKTDAAGVGLPIAKKIVEGHGGTIEVRSDGDRGTTVEVVLPHPEEANPPDALSTET